MTASDDELGRCEMKGCLVPETELIHLEIGGEEFLVCDPCLRDSPIVVLH